MKHRIYWLAFDKEVQVGNNDTVSSLVCLLIGLSFVAGGVAMGLGPLNAPGAGFFPAVIGGLFSLLSGALFLKAFLERKPNPGKEEFLEGRDEAG